MTEAQWLACEDPQKMIAFVRGVASERKLRLVAVGFCRQAWRWVKDPLHRRVVQAAEDFADGQITSDDLEVARSAAWASSHQSKTSFANQAARAVAGESPGAAAHQAQRLVVQQLWRKTPHSYADLPDTKRKVQQCQCDLLREIIGNPFRAIDHDRTWLTATVITVAQAVYDERILSNCHFDLHRLAVLADALEEAGCDTPEILDHLRSPGPHVRGCFPLDLLLGKE